MEVTTMGIYRGDVKVVAEPAFIVSHVLRILAHAVDSPSSDVQFKFRQNVTSTETHFTGLLVQSVYGRRMAFIVPPISGDRYVTQAFDLLADVMDASRWEKSQLLPQLVQLAHSLKDRSGDDGGK